MPTMGAKSAPSSPIWPGYRGLSVAYSVRLGLHFTMSRQWWGVDLAPKCLVSSPDGVEIESGNLAGSEPL